MANDTNNDPLLASLDPNAPPDRRKRAVLAGVVTAAIGAGLCFFGWSRYSSSGGGAGGAGGRTNLGNAQRYDSSKDPVKVTVDTKEAFVDTSTGILTILSGICTHQGCPVVWNGTTGTYACPCHESIFSRSGAVVQGPAKQPLPLIPHSVEDGILYADA